MNRLASPEEAEDKSKSQVGPMEAWGAELMKRQREREMQETRESARESARRERAEMKRHWTLLSTPAFATGPEPKKPSIESQAERKKKKSAATKKQEEVQLGIRESLNAALFYDHHLWSFN
jgi:hypothetical protein